VILVGEREQYNRLALAEGPALDTLVIRRLYEMQDPDFAKAWSFFDYLMHEGGVKSQVWLREGCDLYAGTLSFASAWRESSEELFEVENEDAYRVLDQRWRAFAEAFGGEEPERRRR
jgi:hypothetical protein